MKVSGTVEADVDGLLKVRRVFWCAGNALRDQHVGSLVARWNPLNNGGPHVGHDKGNANQRRSSTRRPGLTQSISGQRLKFQLLVVGAVSGLGSDVQRCTVLTRIYRGEVCMSRTPLQLFQYKRARGRGGLAPDDAQSRAAAAIINGIFLQSRSQVTWRLRACLSLSSSVFLQQRPSQ